jgi:hypothetical protein
MRKEMAGGSESDYSFENLAIAPQLRGLPALGIATKAKKSQLAAACCNCYFRQVALSVISFLSRVHGELLICHPATFPRSLPSVCHS